MECDVIVVGAGIGGLTTAALLSARGLDVCVFERQSQPGGCVANFEHLGYQFEPTYGMYSGWGNNGIWSQIFTELSVPPPTVTRLSPNYAVRLPDGRDVPVSADPSALEDGLAAAFPDCASAAIRFLRQMTGNTPAASPAGQLLDGTSRAFRWFIEAQLQTFAQCTTERCTPERAAAALRMATGELWSIKGGAQTLADRLSDSLKSSGGSLRLNSPVLRLAYGADASLIGVDLLSGERIIAKRAVVSNLTIWDTYGKLMGPTRTPRDIAIELKKLSSWGTYVMFLGIDEAASERLPAPRTLLVYDSRDDRYDPEHQQLLLNLSADGPTAPQGKRALTAIAFTRPDDWFSFHEDHTWHEEKDQAALETWWPQLHHALPELGDAVEVIETSTPQTVYDATRRRLGSVGAPTGGSALAALVPPFDNLFLVGDTASNGLGLEGVAASALSVANKIVPTRP